MELCGKYKCTGCGACFNACKKEVIIFREDEEGFLYPEINDKECIRCGKCVRSCPQLKKELRDSFDELECYAAWTKDENIRSKSSSGGVFAAVSKYIIANSGVVFGAAYNDDFSVCHIMVENINDLSRLQGSKYVQSNVKKTYLKCKEELEKGRLVLFSGTPCQIDGLNHFLDKEYENLYTIDILCHGVPSQRVINSYIRDIEMRYESKVKKLDFRDKTTDKGWEHSCHVKVLLENGKIINSDSESVIFWESFLNNIYLRKNCYSCVYAGKKRVGDITIGDFWGIQSVETNIKFKGISLVIVNTNKGQKIFDVADLEYERHLVSEAMKGNQTLVAPFEMGPNRRKFFNIMEKKGFKKAVYKALPKQMFKNNIFIFTHKSLGDNIYNKLRKLKM